MTAGDNIIKKIFIEAIPLVEDKPSGIAHSLAGLVSGLVESCTDEYEIILVAPKRGLDKLDRWPKLAICKRKPIPLRLKIINLLIKLNLMPKMDLLLGKGIYVFGNFKNWPLSKDSKSITFIHDVCYLIHPEFVSPPNQRFLQNNVPTFISRTSIVATVSQSSKRELVERYKLADDKVAVIYNAVDTSLYKKYSKVEIGKTRAKYIVPEKYFIFLGSIEPRKNLARLIDAFSSLEKAKSGDIALLIIGGMGWLNEDILLAIKNHVSNGIKIIKPPNYVDDYDVARLLSGAQALVQPSLHEGFSMPPLEALASKTPIIISDIPVHKEIFKDIPVYFDAKSVDSLKFSLNSFLLLSDVEKETVAKNGEDIYKAYTWSGSAECMTKLFESIKH